MPVASNVVTGLTLGSNPLLRAGHTSFFARTEAKLAAHTPGYGSESTPAWLRKD
jgi:hypothetical protein